MVLELRKKIEEKIGKNRVSDYYGFQRLYIGEINHERFKNLDVSKISKLLNSIKEVKNREEHGLVIEVRKHPEDERGKVWIEFEDRTNDNVVKKYKTMEKWEQDVGRRSGHSIELDKKEGIITFNLGLRGSSNLTDKQRELYLKIIEKLRNEN